MENQRSALRGDPEITSKSKIMSEMSITTNKSKSVSKKTEQHARGDCDESEATSHTVFFKKERHQFKPARVTRDQYLGVEESISGSSDSYGCVHGPEGRLYSKKTLLKRNLLKELDPVPVERAWTEGCPPAGGCQLARTLERLVTGGLGMSQPDRFHDHLRDFAKTSEGGYKIDVLDSVCVILDFLLETYPKEPCLRESFVLLLNNTKKPVLLNKAMDIVTYFDRLRSYIGYLGYLLLRLEEDELFETVARAVSCLLCAPDAVRGAGAVPQHSAVAAAAPVLVQSTARMLAIAPSIRFPAFMRIALSLACDSINNCIELMKENIIENIFYRFNPYFPEKELPTFEVSPVDPQDTHVLLGDSTVHMSMTLSLLLVLVTTLKQCCEKEPGFHEKLPCPDSYGLRCFAWAYRYECRAPEHQHQRTSLTVVAAALLRCFGRRLEAFSTELMPDIMMLSVLTEVPFRGAPWLRRVAFDLPPQDMQFKMVLLHFCVELLKTFPYNRFLMDSQCWLMGLMWLLDPGLRSLRKRWSSTLFAELRKTALQVLVCALPMARPGAVGDYGLIRRIMWYIEWYSEKPYELVVLYWCMRVLLVATHRRGSAERQASIRDLFDTHGIIILMNLCNTLTAAEVPPVEKRQVILALTLRLLTSALEANKEVACCVYPRIRWPFSINGLARKMLHIVLVSLSRNCIISDRWLITLLTFIWEGIIWNNKYRKEFLSHDGVFKLLDLVTMTRPPVQCVALAMVCDAARAGEAVGQLVSWRAGVAASNANPVVVKRGATIACLLASVFRDECQKIGVPLHENGIIQAMLGLPWRCSASGMFAENKVDDFFAVLTKRRASFMERVRRTDNGILRAVYEGYLDYPLRSTYVRNALSNPNFSTPTNDRTPVCYAAAELAGSRMSKAFALLHMLSEDLDYKVSLADEAYNLYKNIELAPEDEAILVLCAHYLTAKLLEAWSEVQIQSSVIDYRDRIILEEFLHISKGWAVEINRQQEEVVERDRKKKYEQECSLYEFLGRVRLNTALEALRAVRCTARSADRERIMHAMLLDAVEAHLRRSRLARTLGEHVERTYGPSLDDQNITGQYVKVYSIHQKIKPKTLDRSAS